MLAEFANLKAKASIDFGSSDSFFLALKGIKIRQLAEPQLLLNAMLAAYKQRPRRWHKDWVFVDRVGIASNLTVILAKEAKTTVLLKASTTAKVETAAEVDLAAGFKFVASSKGVTQITSARKLVAFYSAYRVRRRAVLGAGDQPGVPHEGLRAGSRPVPGRRSTGVARSPRPTTRSDVAEPALTGSWFGPGTVLGPAGRPRTSGSAARHSRNPAPQASTGAVRHRADRRPRDESHDGGCGCGRVNRGNPVARRGHVACRPCVSRSTTPCSERSRPTSGAWRSSGARAS